MSVSDTDENNSKYQIRMLERYLVRQNLRLENLILSFESYSTIDLSCQKLIDSDMAIILKYAIHEKQCHVLNLWGNRFTQESIFILSNTLQTNQTLTELDLSHNQLTDEGVRILCDILSLNQCYLKELDLSANFLTDQSAEYLGNMLRKNTNLEYLFLNQNDLSNHGLKSIANALVNDNQRLKQLKIESNPEITRNGLIDFVNLLKSNEIFEEIYVKNCSISERDFDMLEQLSFTTGFDIIVSNRTSIVFN